MVGTSFDPIRFAETAAKRIWCELLSAAGQLEAEHPSHPVATDILAATLAVLITMCEEST